jgi:4-diphosphocytidyl-2-C-methyl-D-erythritol kinase
MKTIRIEAPAKINLTLDVLRKRPDGYHDMSMVMQTIQLCDILHLEEIHEGIQVFCSDPRIPCDRSNLVYKAAETLMKHGGLQKGIRIHIEKHIPLEAGLAGGSADAAAVLKGLATMWGLPDNLEEWMALGNTIGADVPFCLMGGTALAEGTGNVLTPLTSLPHYHVVLVKPGFGISTGKAFSTLDLNGLGPRPDNEKMREALQTADRAAIEAGLVNVFEQGAFKEHPVLKDIKKQLLEQGAQASLMSGSGPTMYGLFRSKERAMEAHEHFRHIYEEVFLTETSDQTKGEEL